MNVIVIKADFFHFIHQMHIAV